MVQLYIRTLVIEDKNGATIFKIQNKKAQEGLQQALSIVENKDSKQTTLAIIKNYIKELDKELEEYFKL